MGKNRQNTTMKTKAHMNKRWPNEVERSFVSGITYTSVQKDTIYKDKRPKMKSIRPLFIRTKYQKYGKIYICGTFPYFRNFVLIMEVLIDPCPYI